MSMNATQKAGVNTDGNVDRQQISVCRQEAVKHTKESQELNQLLTLYTLFVQCNWTAPLTQICFSYIQIHLSNHCALVHYMVHFY